MINNEEISRSEIGCIDDSQSLYEFAKSNGMNVNDTQAWLKLCRVFYDKDEYYTAIECLDEALKLGKSLKNIYALKAIIYYKQRRYHWSIHFSNKVTDINPDEFNAWYLKGDAYYHIRKYGKATKCLDKALSLRPDDYASLKLWDSSIILSQKYPDQSPSYTKKKMEKDAKEIVNAILTGAEHQAVFYKKEKIVLNPRKISYLADASSQTVGERVNRLKGRIREIMTKQTGYVETYYGSMLAYQTNTRRLQE